MKKHARRIIAIVVLALLIFGIIFPLFTGCSLVDRWYECPGCKCGVKYPPCPACGCDFDESTAIYFDPLSGG